MKTILGAAETTDVSDEASEKDPIRPRSGRTGAERGTDGRYLPGLRPRGAPKGNVNAVRHPWDTYWRRRALRHCDRWVLRQVIDYVPNLIVDKGGEGNVSFAEQKVMEVAAAARLCWQLALSYQAFSDAARFQVIEVKCLGDLGLKRRAKEINPRRVLEEAVARANQLGEQAS